MIRTWGLKLGTLLAVVLGLIGIGRCQGSKRTQERVSRRVQAASEAREGKRDEIDTDVAGGNAVEQLRNDWSRD